MPAAPTIYLDNNASTPVDPRVLEEMLPTLTQHFGNPASSTHPFGWYAEELVKIARERVSVLIAARPEEIVFTSGATESNNLALIGLVRAARKRQGEGPLHLITAATEHKSVLDTLRELENEGVELTIISVRSDGTVVLDQVLDALRASTVAVSLMLANNEVGAIHPIANIGSELRARKILFHCDAVQAAGKLPINVSELGVDFLSLSAHKLYGPKGVGALFVREIEHGALTPQMHGGGHERGLRSGTLNVSGIVGLGKAAELALLERDKDVLAMREHSSLLLRLLLEGLPDLQLNGPPLGAPETERLPGNLNLYIPGVDNVRLLGSIQTKVAFSLGSACQSASNIPSFVLQALGHDRSRQSNSFRLGIGRFTTTAEIESAARIILNAIKRL